MPIENEIKRVLRVSSDLERQIEKLANGRLLIKQGYLHRKEGLTVRVRKQINQSDLPWRNHVDQPWRAQDGSTQLLLQTKLKQKVGKTSKVVEVSADLSQSDFEFYWKAAKGRIRKIRYLIESGVCKEYKSHLGKPWREVWEVDFFKTARDKTYFAVAECEMPDGVEQPLLPVPDLIRKNTVFKVPIRDTRFSNSRLSDVKYATDLYVSLFSCKGL